MKNAAKKILGYIIMFIHNIAVSMKDFFIRIFNIVVSLFGGKKKAVTGKKLKLTGKPVLVKTSSAGVKHKPADSAHVKKTWWKNRLVWAGTALVVAAAVVLPILLTGAGEKSDTDGSPISADAKTTSGEENTQQDTGGETIASMQGVQIDNSVDADTNTIPTTTPQHTPIVTTEPVEEDLAPGVHDTRLLTIQERLMELGYLDWDEPSDYYGYGTEYALQLFQRKHGLQVDGIAGDLTLEQLFAESAAPYTVKLGDRGTDVESIQKRLQELKYLKAGSTGYFGTDTESAVKSFQKRNGLYADGNVGEQTREALFSQDARPAATSSGGSSGSSGSSGGTGNQPVVVGDPDNASADAFVAFALTQLGKPYVRGGKGPSSFDCSGFVYYCLNSVGFKINYMTSTAWRSANYPTITNFKDVKKGDILCFNGHVGIYMGNGKMVDASSSNGKVVTRSNIFSSSYWTKNFRCAKRVF